MNRHRVAAEANQTANSQIDFFESHTSLPLIFKQEPLRDTRSELSKGTNVGPRRAKGICRCCLSEGRFESMELTNISSGFNQSYVEILYTTLGLTFESTDVPRLICSSCAVQLRQALAFRKQVVAAEKAFIAKHKPDNNVETTITVSIPPSSTYEVTMTSHNKPYNVQPKIEDKVITLLESDDDSYNDEFNSYDVSLNTIPLVKSYTDAVQESPKQDKNKKNNENKLNSTQSDEDVDDFDMTNGYQFHKCNICKEEHVLDDYPQCRLCEHVFLNLQDKVYHTMCDKFQCSFCKIDLKEKKGYHYKICKYISCLHMRRQIASASSRSEDSSDKTEQPQFESVRIPGPDIYSCEICKTEHYFYELREKHAKYRRYSCVSCKLVLGDESKLKHCHSDHRRMCFVCDETFPTIDLKKSHLLTVHGKKCSICNERVLMCNSTEHNTKMHGAKVNMCGICMKTFKHSSYLVKHQRKVHMMERNEPCNKCKYVAYDKADLSKHMKAHSNKKDFQCDYCNKKFTRRTTLIFHIRIHTGEKNKLCKICGEAFVQRASLKYHLEKYHPGDFY